MHGTRRDGAGRLPRDLAGCGLRDCARNAWTSIQKKFISDAQQTDERCAYLFRRNRQEVLGIVRNVADELRVSRFAPCDEELAFSKDGALPPVYVETPEGQAVLSGFVDRVDVLDEPGGSISV